MELKIRDNEIVWLIRSILITSKLNVVDFCIATIKTWIDNAISHDVTVETKWNERKKHKEDERIFDVYAYVSTLLFHSQRIRFQMRRKQFLYIDL